MAIDTTDTASAAWIILTKKFESTDPSKISIVRMKYENYHVVEGQSVITYLMTMKEYKNQLEKLGESITDSTHTATILRNLPESWRVVSQTIRMITGNPDIIEEQLEAHEADLNALEISTLAATTFIAQVRPKRLISLSHLFRILPHSDITMFNRMAIHNWLRSPPSDVTTAGSSGIPCPSAMLPEVD